MHDWRELRPVIIVGMHRSGTTMITQILEQLGLFVGQTKDDNWEARLFQLLNDTLLHTCGGAWDNPAPVYQLLNHEPLITLATDYICNVLKSPHLISYMGIGSYLRRRALQNLTSPWGWKDPRNILFLRIWIRLFPNAILVYVRRHGVDVAASLRTRVLTILDKGNWRKQHHNIPMLLNPIRSRAAFSPRCYSLEGAFSLWEEYMNFAEREMCNIEYLQIDYESFLQDPVPNALRLGEYCKLNISRKQVEKACRLIKGGRAFAYQNRQDLSNFAIKVQDRLTKFGY